jgi:thiamine-monophosphate kinase
VAAIARFERLPASATLRRFHDRQAAREAMLAGGDDYELVFTAGRNRRAAIARLGQRLRLDLTCIGSIIARRRGTRLVTVLDAGGRPVALGKTGYKHF